MRRKRRLPLPSGRGSNLSLKLIRNTLKVSSCRDADTGLITLGCLHLFSPVIYGGFITSSFEKDISISFYRFIIQCFPIFLGGGGSFHLKSVCWLELDLICNCCCVR